MPLFMRRKIGEGKYVMEEVTEQPVKDVPISVPLSATVSQVAGARPYHCTACTPPKGFAGAGVLSMHFKREHKNLYKDKDSWRQYCSEFGDVGDE
ncbi:MAG: hypothetical protein A2Y38_18935 [Spirochaetes bacterium GWB1_59_5]|nr:MAG: hypothetical protein A2Y38_18935 [Spirochaetes bacterium GWB1_59_5]